MLVTSSGFLSEAWIPGAALFVNSEFARRATENLQLSAIPYLADQLRPFWSDALVKKSTVLGGVVKTFQPVFTEPDNSPAIASLAYGAKFGQEDGPGMASASLSESGSPFVEQTFCWCRGICVFFTAGTASLLSTLTRRLLPSQFSPVLNGL